eukprot:365359-Chlamydomonas_euryale.AAC.7
MSCTLAVRDSGGNASYTRSCSRTRRAAPARPASSLAAPAAAATHGCTQGLALAEPRSGRPSPAGGERCGKVWKWAGGLGFTHPKHDGGQAWHERDEACGVWLPPARTFNPERRAALPTPRTFGKNGPLSAATRLKRWSSGRAVAAVNADVSPDSDIRQGQAGRGRPRARAGGRAQERLTPHTAAALAAAAADADADAAASVAAAVAVAGGTAGEDDAAAATAAAAAPITAGAAAAPAGVLRLPTVR